MSKFKSIAIMSRAGVQGAEETLTALHAHFINRGVTHFFAESSSDMAPENADVIPDKSLGKHADLLIVVGGDGSLINAAHIAIDQSLPVLGVNRGRLGFLTDIHPQELDSIDAIIAGDYTSEERLLLQAEIPGVDEPIIALNDLVLMPDGLSQMVIFSVTVNDQLLYAQRADGLIIATPTGSTAYALSGGGPILQPQTNAITLVPMFPHTLSSRPIVISADSKVVIHVSPSNPKPLCLSNDGRARYPISGDQKILIKRYPAKIRLIHPADYNYYQMLQTKLNWEKHAERTHL